MRPRKRPQENIMRNVFLSLAALFLLTLTSFSLQFVYSNNLTVDLAKGYGMFQNEVFQDTGDVLVPSPYAAQRVLIEVSNGENYTRNITLSITYKGNILKVNPSAQSNGSNLVWNSWLLPHETKEFYIIGKDLEVGTPFVFPREQSPQTTNYSVPQNSSTSSAGPIINFTYSQDGTPDIIGSVFSEGRKLDIVSKSVVTIFAGLVVLTVASGFAFIFGKEEKPKNRPSTKIHMTDIYHNDEKAELLQKYQYSENEYWKEEK